VPLEPPTEDALKSIAAEMKIGQSDLIQIVLLEWLETNAYLPVRMIDGVRKAGLPRSHHRLTQSHGSQYNYKRSIPQGCSRSKSPPQVAPVAGFSSIRD
jgi:hypothetical protein